MYTHCLEKTSKIGVNANAPGNHDAVLMFARDAFAALFAAAVAVAGARLLSGGASALAAGSMLLRRGVGATPAALALVAFPGAFACLWALDVAEAVGPSALDATLTSLRSIAADWRASVVSRRRPSAAVLPGIRMSLPSSPGQAISRALKIAALARLEHLSGLPRRAASPAFWRRAWAAWWLLPSRSGSSAPRRRPRGVDAMRALTRWLVAAALLSAIRPFVTLAAALALPWRLATVASLLAAGWRCGAGVWLASSSWRPPRTSCGAQGRRCSTSRMQMHPPSSPPPVS